MTLPEEETRVAGGLLAAARRHWVYLVVPFVLILALVVALLLADQSASPFIYTLF